MDWVPVVHWVGPSMRAVSWWTVCFLTALIPSAQAQTLNPSGAQFTASADQNAVAADGVTPLVSGYALGFYLVSAAQPFQVVPLGKPTPDVTNTITVNFAAVLGAAFPSPGLVYNATVSAIGPGGTSPSALSNTFEFVGACSYAVSPTSASLGSGGGPASVTIAATSGCGWTATSNASWLTIIGGGSGSGGATITYTVATNTLTGARSGTLTVGGQAITVTQAGAPCAYTASPTSASLGSGGGAASVAVTTTNGCGWTALSQAGWLTVTSGASGSGSGLANYSAAPNTSKSPQVGVLTIAGLTITVTEAAPSRPLPPGHVRVVKTQ